MTIKTMTYVIATYISLSWLIGYMIWVMYASRIGLGWLDPWELRGRSVVSGLLPAALLIGLHPLTKGIRLFYQWLQRDISMWERKLGGYFTILGIPFFFLYVFFHGFSPEDNPWATRFSIIWLGCWLVGSLFTGRENDKGSKLLAVVYVALTGGLILVGFVAVYAWLIFPKLPNELGGPASECIVLDIDPAEYSKETINALTGLPKAEQGAVRSKPIQLILSTNEFLYLKIREPSDVRTQFHQLSWSGVKHRSHCPNAT